MRCVSHCRLSVLECVWCSAADFKMKPTFSEKKNIVHSVNIEPDDAPKRLDKFLNTLQLTLLRVGLILLCLTGIFFVEKQSQIIHKVYNKIFSRAMNATPVQGTGVTFRTEEKVYSLSDEFINIVNSKATTWVAGRNFANTSSLGTISRMMGVKKRSQWINRSLLFQATPNIIARNIKEVPENFDARDQWPQCASIGDIRDQGGCGSCWAVGSAETMTDRHCIFTGESVYYSAEDILSCCDWCGDGCSGGDPDAAFFYWEKHGVVSGGPYNSQQGCRPYEIEACEHHINGSLPPCQSGSDTPQCKESCQSNYNKTYDEDRHYAASIYSIDTGVNAIQVLQELASNGPMEGNFDVYEDFLHYKSGVYQHVHGEYLGAHAIKVIGYGIEEGVPYYLCANSWNTDWGDRGFFKISRKEMDSDFTTGIPLKIYY